MIYGMVTSKGSRGGRSSVIHNVMYTAAMAVLVTRAAMTLWLWEITELAGSVASALIDGALHRETSNWNHIPDDTAFLDSPGH